MCPIETVKPYALMIAPVYVFMHKNGKFVAVKAPLDFFTEQELAQLKNFEKFFMPEFIEKVLPYRQAARRLRKILHLHPEGENRELGLSPFEISDAVVRLLAPFWGPKQRVESFFASVFANEFCDFLPSDDLMKAREANLDRFESSLMISAWMVLLSLLLGVTDPAYLDRLRLNSFRRNPEQIHNSDARELYRILQEKLEGGPQHSRSLGIDFFEERSERVARKIIARLTRIREISRKGPTLEATIYGDEGFVHV